MKSLAQTGRDDDTRHPPWGNHPRSSLCAQTVQCSSGKKRIRQEGTSLCRRSQHDEAGCNQDQQDLSGYEKRRQAGEDTYLLQKRAIPDERLQTPLEEAPAIPQKQPSETGGQEVEQRSV